MSNVIDKLFFNRAFLLTGEKLFQLSIEDQSLVPVEQSTIQTQLLSIVIVGRDHCREITKRYPVTDRKELSKILKLENAEECFIEVGQLENDGFKVKSYVFDGRASAILNEQMVVKIPEGYLFNKEDNDCFWRVERAKTVFYMLKTNGVSFSSIVKGTMSDTQSFLMSVGANIQLKPDYVDEKNYASKLINQVKSLRASDWLSLTFQNRLFEKLANSFKWSSMLVGAFVGYLIFSFAHLTYLSYLESSLLQKISEQKVAAVVKKQRSVEQQLKSLTDLSGVFTNQKQADLIWQLLAEIGEKQSTIIYVRLVDKLLEVRLEAKSAVDILEHVRSLSTVKTASFSTSVARSRNRERFTLQVAFGRESDQVED